MIAPNGASNAAYGGHKPVKLEIIKEVVNMDKETIWVAELADSDDFEVMLGAETEEEAEEMAWRELGDNWLYVHEVEI